MRTITAASLRRTRIASSRLVPSLLIAPTCRPIALPHSHTQVRPFFSVFKKKTPAPAASQAPHLSQDDLFHHLSESPFPALREKADRIKSVSLCPTSFEKHHERVRPAYDCPDCGWPTHKNRERWEEGREEHKEYCGRLREVNEDEHDLRSGRPMVEFENMPG